MTKTALIVLLLYSAPGWSESPPRFPENAVWHQNIAAASVHPDSASMISQLDTLGGFGTGVMRIDFSLHVVPAQAEVPMRTIQWTPGGYYSADCEPIGTSIPVPENAAIEGTEGLSCEDADCHLLVVQGKTLYEAYRANGVGEDKLETQCLVIWELDRTYPPEGRGEHCTSADAAGFPMAPLVFNADEIAASLAADNTGGGNLGHAIRFILPNDHMASDEGLGGASGRLYVRPASHAGAPSGPKESVPFGSRWRLKSDFDTSAYNSAEKVVLNTFKNFGIVLADGGNIALTAESDLYTTTKWSELDIGAFSFSALTVNDFEVIDTGARIAETYECVRTVFPDELMYEDGFEAD